MRENQKWHLYVYTIPVGARWQKHLGNCWHLTYLKVILRVQIKKTDQSGCSQAYETDIWD
mgnify:FL=1